MGHVIKLDSRRSADATAADVLSQADVLIRRYAEHIALRELRDLRDAVRAWRMAKLGGGIA